MLKSMYDVIVGLFVVVVVGYLYISFTSEPEKRPITNSIISGEENNPLGTTDQGKFIEIVSRYRREFLETNNEVAQGLSRKRRGEEICRTFESRYFRSWAGRISRVSTSSNGQSINKIEIELVNSSFNSSLKIVDTTGHPPGSRMHNILLNEAGVGDIVVFNGEFRYDHDKRISDCFYETRLTLRGGMLEPAYSARIIVLKKIDTE